MSVKDLLDLSGKVAVVTGGGRGIGAETARALARCGARVAIGDLDLQAAEQTAAGLPGDAVGLSGGWGRSTSW